jgi:hypothetical protein
MLAPSDDGSPIEIRTADNDRLRGTFDFDEHDSEVVGLLCGVESDDVREVDGDWAIVRDRGATYVQAATLVDGVQFRAEIRECNAYSQATSTGSMPSPGVDPVDD